MQKQVKLMRSNTISSKYFNNKPGPASQIGFKQFLFKIIFPKFIQIHREFIQSFIDINLLSHIYFCICLYKKIHHHLLNATLNLKHSYLKLEYIKYKLMCHLIIDCFIQCQGMDTALQKQPKDI